MRSTTDSSASRVSGFTLIELLVVMGILSGFLMMLVSLVDSGLTMFRDGETSQVLADRGARAQQVIRDELSRLRGSSTGRDRTEVEDRLVVRGSATANEEARVAPDHAAQTMKPLGDSGRLSRCRLLRGHEVRRPGDR